jgi:ABC-2 type transport system permease protein
MTTFGVLMRKEMREQWRTYRLVIICVIAFVFGLISPLLAKYLPELLKNAAGPIQFSAPVPTVGDAVDQTIKNLGSSVGTFGAILLAMGLVAREKERGTAAFVLTKPASRLGFLASKFIGLALTLGAAIFLGGLAAYGYTTLLFEALPIGGFLACLSLLLLAALVYGTVTFFASTLVKSALPAAGIGIGSLIVFSLIGAIPQLKSWTPNALLGPAKALALGQAAEHLWLPVGANLALIGLLLGAAWLSFRHQEL